MKLELTATIARIIEATGALVTGGCIRDLLIGRKPKDIDLITRLKPLEIAAQLEQEGITLIPDYKAFSHGIIRAVDKDTGEIIDIAAYRKDVSTDGRHAQVIHTNSLQEDLARRDLTINAIAARINTNGDILELIDPFNGQQHIKQKLVKFVGNAFTRIKEDHLRIFRAFRFCALDEGWEIGTADFWAIRHFHEDNHENVKRISKERVRDEFVKAISYNKPSNFFRMLHSANVLSSVFPDLALGAGCAQNIHHAGDLVFDHLLRCLDASVQFTDNPLLRLAVLTHDIAKPHTKAPGAKYDFTFYNHEVEGEKIMRAWMTEYKFSNKDIDYVAKLVRHHQFKFEADVKDRVIRKWLSQVGPEWQDLLTLRACDRKGNITKQDKPAVTQKMRELIEKIENMKAAGVPLFLEDLAINGHDLEELEIKPGPIYKVLLFEMLNLILEDPDKNTKEWLITWTKNRTKTI